MTKPSRPTKEFDLRVILTVLHSRRFATMAEIQPLLNWVTGGDQTNPTALRAIMAHCHRELAQQFPELAAIQVPTLIGNPLVGQSWLISRYALYGTTRHVAQRPRHWQVWTPTPSDTVFRGKYVGRRTETVALAGAVL
jgi:hypothetical protein